MRSGWRNSRTWVECFLRLCCVALPLCCIVMCCPSNLNTINLRPACHTQSIACYCCWKGFWDIHGRCACIELWSENIIVIRKCNRCNVITWWLAGVKTTENIIVIDLGSRQCPNVRPTEYIFTAHHIVFSLVCAQSRVRLYLLFLVSVTLPDPISGLTQFYLLGDLNPSLH